MKLKEMAYQRDTRNQIAFGFRHSDSYERLNRPLAHTRRLTAVIWQTKVASASK